jgi:hypothetical protein
MRNKKATGLSTSGSTCLLPCHPAIGNAAISRDCRLIGYLGLLAGLALGNLNERRIT